MIANCQLKKILFLHVNTGS